MRLVYGIGINDSTTPIIRKEKISGKWVTVWRCPYYQVWVNMLFRCYNKQKLFPAYHDKRVCEEWLTFSNFRRWMRMQNWENRALDKDLLGGGSNIYSPETCIFVPRKVNNFLVTRENQRGSCPLGVRANKRGYTAQGNGGATGKSLYFGSYDDPLDAHFAYLRHKSCVLDNFIAEFKGEDRLTEGLTTLKKWIDWHVRHRIEIQTLGGKLENMD